MIQRASGSKAQRQRLSPNSAAADQEGSKKRRTSSATPGTTRPLICPVSRLKLFSAPSASYTRAVLI